MQAADEREALRCAGMARADSWCRLRVRYRTADVLRRFVLAQAFIDDLDGALFFGDDPTACNRYFKHIG
jgi:hypothetical protein